MDSDIHYVREKLREWALRDQRWDFSGPPAIAPFAELPPSPIVDMDPRLWGNLQHYVGLENIFAKLPLREFFQLRVVCKEWNRLASDENFLQENAGPPIPKPYFCLAHPHGHWQIILTHNAASNEWRQMPMPLPYKKGSPATCVEGFLCISSRDITISRPGVEVKTTVFDINTWIQHLLPSLFIEDEDYLVVDGMVVHNDKFQVIVAERDPVWQTSIYDSTTRDWTTTRVATSPYAELYSMSHCYGSVQCNDILYISIHDADSIMSYDLGRGIWSRLDKPCNAITTHLGTWEGHLYAVAHVFLDPPTPDSLHLCSNLRMYKLCLPEGAWKEFDIIPENLCEWLFNTDELPEADEIPCDFDRTLIETSFCEQYAFICVFLEDYRVTLVEEHRIWTEQKPMPRRFALYDFATKTWQRIDLPFNSRRERINGGRWCR